jgi:hypothetical protein
MISDSFFPLFGKKSRFKIRTLRQISISKIMKQDKVKKITKADKMDKIATLAPWTDVIIFLNIFAKKIGKKIGAFDSKQR